MILSQRRPLPRAAAMAVAWSALGAGLSLSQVRLVTADARAVVLAAGIALPLAALAAAVSLRRGRLLRGCTLLAVSVLTPTYFAWVLNLLPVVAIAVAISEARTGLKSGHRELSARSGST